jgi:hypothetical protein
MQPFVRGGLMPVIWPITTAKGAPCGMLYSILVPPSDEDRFAQALALLAHTVPAHGFPHGGIFMFRVPLSQLSPRSPIWQMVSGRGVTVWPIRDAPFPSHTQIELAKRCHELQVKLAVSVTDNTTESMLSAHRPDFIVAESSESITSIDPESPVHEDIRNRLILPTSEDTPQSLLHAHRIRPGYVGSGLVNKAAAEGLAAEVSGLLRILALYYQDAPIPEIVDAVRHQPALVERLLRLANSATYQLKARANPMTSLAVILQTLGLSFLRTLCKLGLAESTQGTLVPAVVAVHARIRSDMIERLAGIVYPAVDQDEAFVCGVLSVIQPITGLTMKALLAATSLPSRIDDALLERNGFLGELLATVESFENNTLTGHTVFDPDLSLEVIALAHAEAVAWAMGEHRDVF